MSSSGHKISSPRNSNPEKTAVFTYGRFQPPHIGHALLINHLQQIAERNNATPYVIVSASCNEEWFNSKIFKAQQKITTFKSCKQNENPLPIKRKLYYLRKMFPQIKFIAADEYGSNIFQVIGHISEAGYQRFIGVFGSDRATTFQTMFNRAEEATRIKNEEDPTSLPAIHIEVNGSIGIRDDTADDVHGASATKMREAAVANTPTAREYFIVHSQIGNMSIEDSQQMMEDIRKVLWKEPSPSKKEATPKSKKSPPTTPLPEAPKVTPRRSPRFTSTGGNDIWQGSNPTILHKLRLKKYTLRSDEKLCNCK
jgi:nicotinamide mononucleotide adenylyltransferase